MLSLSGVTGAAASAVARDAPVVFALGACIWSVRRGAWADRPVVFVALALACLGGRLVFESVIFPYYLLASSVLFFLLDLVAQRAPAALARLVRHRGVLRRPQPRQPRRRRTGDAGPRRARRRGRRGRRRSVDRRRRSPSTTEAQIAPDAA